MASFKYKLRNPEELEGISDIEEFFKFLYRRLRVNNVMLESKKRFPASVEVTPVSEIDPQETRESKKKMIMCKLSRIRRKFYLRCDANTASERS